MKRFIVRERDIRTDASLGYMYFMDSEHPLASKIGRVYYHRHLMSVKLGRWLKRGECVHHLDGDRVNNKPENLAVMSASSHAKTHAKQRPSKEKTIIKCAICGALTDNKKYCSYSCSNLGSRIVDRPTKEKLRDCIDSMPWTHIGKKYGVSDNAARKWAKLYDLL